MKFDFNKTYYKVMTVNEKHNGFKYKDGLNILDGEFNDDVNDSCVGNRLYFADYENLPKFFHYGIYIREITIPKDAKVILDRSGDKYAADRLILGKKYHIVYDFHKWFDSERYNWIHSDALCKFCSVHFERWFDPKKFNWNYSYRLAMTCTKYFDKWFDKELYNWEDSDLLAMCCTNHFEKWFDPEKFNWDYIESLKRYCNDYKHIWRKYKPKRKKK